MKSAGHHDNTSLFPGDRRCHRPLARQRTISFKRFGGGIRPRDGTIGEHVPDKYRRIEITVIHLKEMVPEIVRVTRAGAITGRPKKLAAAQMLLIKQAARLLSRLAPTGTHHLGKREVHEADGGLHRIRRPDGGQLGRVFAKRVIGRMTPRRLLGDSFHIRRVDRHREAGLVVEKKGNQRRGVARAFDQH